MDVYYNRYNRRVIDLALQQRVPEGRFLDVGCADGSGGHLLREHPDCRELHGIELDTDAAYAARATYDSVLEGDILAVLPTFPDAGHSLIICSDVLEHLYDPVNAYGELLRILRPHGCLLICLPNLSNIGNLKQIFWRGQFDLMGDETHIKLMAYRDIIARFSSPQLVLNEVLLDEAPGTTPVTRVAACLFAAMPGGLPKAALLARNVVLVQRKAGQLSQ